LLGPDKHAGVVNASRSIIKAWQKGDAKASASLETAADAARTAALAMRDALATA
jgi:hypothetical protein